MVAVTVTGVALIDKRIPEKYHITQAIFGFILMVHQSAHIAVGWVTISLPAGGENRRQETLPNHKKNGILIKCSSANQHGSGHILMRIGQRHAARLAII